MGARKRIEFEGYGVRFLLRELSASKSIKIDAIAISF